MFFKIQKSQGNLQNSTNIMSTFVNIMSLLLQCVSFQVNTVYSFVGLSSLKGFWAHYMDSRARLDGRWPVGPGWDLDHVDLA